MDDLAIVVCGGGAIQDSGKDGNPLGTPWNAKTASAIYVSAVQRRFSSGGG
jgi:hypothetical protein